MKQTKYWFKRRRYGYGWTPSSKQGWGLLVGGVALMLIGAMAMDNTASPGLWILAYLGFVLVIVVMLIAVTYKKGPSPKWRWGKKDSDNPDEDF